MNAYEETLKGVQWVLDNCTSYRVAKELGINARTVNRYQNDESPIGNMTAETLGKLYNYYLEEMGNMENIKNIIEGLENGTVEVDNEESYEDINGAEYVSHFVEGHEDLEVLFEKREDANEVDPNELDDVYNYNKVVAYRINGGNIDWV